MKKRILSTLLISSVLLLLGTALGFTQEGAGASSSDGRDSVRLLEPVVIDPNQEYAFEGEEVPYYMSNLYLLVVDAFERAGEWRGEMSRDEGIITVRRIYGQPRALAFENENADDPRGFSSNEMSRTLGWPTPPGETEDGTPVTGGLPATVDLAGSLQEESEREGMTYVWTPPRYKTRQGHYEYRYFDAINVPDVQELRLAAANMDGERQSLFIPNERCLGVKIQFMRRGFNEFAIMPPKPIDLDGVVKGMEVWVVGRNKRHELYGWIEDINGNDRYVPFGDLNFLGWRKLVATVSPLIRQEDWMFNNARGIRFKGFVVKCNPEDSYGNYYMYLDNFSVLIDRYFEENRSIYDPSDMW